MDRRRVAERDWLTHTWDFSIESMFMAGATTFTVMAGGCGLAVRRSREEAQAWIANARPRSIEQLVTQWAGIADVLVLIEGGRTGRLARIPRHLWRSYDALQVSGDDLKISLLSAKARALFPDVQAVFVRAYRR